MTLAQIEKTRSFLNTVDSIKDLHSMEIFVGELHGFYGDIFSVSLKVFTLNTIQLYSTPYLESDKATIKSFLESQLAKDDNYVVVSEILSLIEEGCKIIDEKEGRRFLTKIYNAYSGKIVFSKMIETIASAPKDFVNMGMLPDAKDVLPGIITKLKDYARDICTPKQSEVCAQPLVQVNNTATSNASAYVQVDISTLINQAYKKAEDEGLPDVQLKEIKEKLAGIEAIAKSNESKGKRWQKAKEILKWVIEQGIQVAGIVLPLLAPMIG